MSTLPSRNRRSSSTTKTCTRYSYSLYSQNFARFGKIDFLFVKQDRAYILYSEVVNAYFAKICHNDFVIEAEGIEMKAQFVQMDAFLPTP